MQFRYYITGLYLGQVLGTNDSNLAENLRNSEDHFIIDTLKGVWLSSKKELDIQEMEDPI